MKIIYLSVFFIFLTQLANAENTIIFNKSENPEFHETIYSASDDSCGIEWHVKYFSQSPGFGISEHSKCKLPLDKQTTYRNLLLQKVVIDTNNLQGLRNFFWGRLRRGDSNDEYAEKLSRSVALSKHWNSKKGIVVQYSQGVNRFIMDILNQDKIFSEVIDTFEHAGFELKVNDVEKVLIGNDADQKTGIFSKGKYPVDCTVTFGVSPKNSNLRRNP